VSHAHEAIRLRRLGFHPIVERTNSKLPAEMAWQKLVNRSDEELERVFEKMPAGGIGTVTHGFVVIDLDVRPDKDGFDSLRKVEAQHGALPETLSSVTPSGGRHLFFRVPEGVEVRNSVSKLGPGIDVRGTGGQVVLPPTVVNGASYAWVDGDVSTMSDLPPAWLQLLTRAEEAKAAAVPAPARIAPSSAPRRIRTPDDARHEAERRARYMATVTEPSIQGSGGNAVMMKAAFHAKEMSRNAGEALAALLDWNARCAQPEWSEDELLRAIQNSEAAFGAGLDKDKPAPEASPESQDAVRDVAWVESMQSYVARDKKTGTWNLQIPLSERGAQAALVSRGLSAPAAKAALKDFHITLAHSVECEPSEGPSFQRDGQTILNNYIPPTLKPASGVVHPDVDFPVLNEVLGFVTCGDQNAKHWLLNWMAFAAQNPARPMRTVPVLYGAQKTGKSLTARAMQTLIGEANCATIRNEDVKNKFTSHFVQKLFVAVSEIEAGEVTHATSTLKYLTGEPQLVHEAKGSSAFYVQNRIKMMCNSNQTLPVAVEGDGDTRWVLFKQMDSPGQAYVERMDSLFDQATNQWSAKGIAELSALLAFLLAFPVDVQLARAVYKNDARVAAVEASRSSIEQFVEAVNGSSLDAIWMSNVSDYERTATTYEHMDFAQAPTLTGAAALYGTYRAFCRASGLQPLGMSRFPGEVERHAPAWKRHKVHATIAATRPWAYSGVPRERRLRQVYLTNEMKQASLFPEAQKPAPAPSNTLAVPVKEAIAAVNKVFETEEDVPF
jgi:phage/plasmid-associated DNA primase